jgi:hypothetical protein
MRILNSILALMFLAFAFVQINDPDPIIWILIYGAMATLCIMAIFEYYPKKFMIGLLGFYLGYSIEYFNSVWTWIKSDNKSALFDDVAKMQNLYIEESREFLGLMICVSVLIFYLIRSSKK